jgi:uncharacterized protein YgfB (UPF0149 family)
MNIISEDIWQIAGAVITALGGGAAIVFALSSWLAKVWANRILESDKAKYQKEFAELKTELDKRLHAHNVAIARLDGQRTKAIRDIYDALTAWFEAYLDITTPNLKLSNSTTEAIQTYQKLCDALYAASEKLSKEYLRTAIDFKEETCRTITECGQCSMEISAYFCNSVVHHPKPNSPEHLQAIEEARECLRLAGTLDFIPKKDQLLKAFRRIIDPLV